MANDGQIVFQVEIDGKNVKADIKDITRMIQSEAGKWDDAGKQASDNIGNNFSSMLKKIAVGFSAVKIGKSLLDLGKDAIEAASALEEVQNVVDVTFGQGANQIDAWAKQAGAQFGLTETQAKKFASTMGAMMKSSGMAGDEIVGMSKDLAGLAADMASFYNLDFEEAFAKIRSGMSGITMPLKELGIDMSVANLNAFALKQGLTKTFDQMTQSEQTVLRYQYLMQATADAQGDFARTSDGYANSVRKLETNVNALKTALGSTFLDVVAGAVGALNGFLEMLLPDESKRTVLDDFADIDLKADEKLAQIRETAEEARALSEELDRIGGSKADKAGSKIQQLATDLSNINLDEGKAAIVTNFIDTLAQDYELLGAIQGTDAQGAKDWLDGIAESANKLDEGDAQGWIDLIEEIKAGLPGIENTDFGAAFLGALGDEFGGVSEKASVLSWMVSALGDKTNKTADEQRLWLETCKRLVQTIPGLSSVINTETGEIKGGTQAVYDYIEAWEKGQTKLAMLGALEQKEAAYDERFSDLPGLELDAAVAEHRLRKAKDDYQKLIDEYKLDWNVDKVFNMNPGSAEATSLGLSAEQVEALNAASAEVQKFKGEAITTAEAYRIQKEALDEAKVALKEYREVIEEMPDGLEDAENATEQWLKTVGKTSDEITELVNNAQTALVALGDYVQGVHDAVTEAVDATVHGFKRIEYLDFGTTQEKLTQLAKDQAHFAKGSDEWNAVQAQIDDLNESLVTTGSIMEDLQSQADFLDDYLANIQRAKELGMSDELLAELSDGSVESAQILAAIVNDQGGGMMQDVEAKYAEVQEKKKQLADSLAENQLAVDDVYKQLEEDAKNAVAALDLQQEAQNNTGKTIQGIAQGIADHVGEVQEAVDSIISELDRLNNYGINLGFGSYGSIPVLNSGGMGGATIGQYETGLNYVPFDGFLASLHEGEGILTAEENRIWQNFKTGGRDVDYDTLGGVMRDNIQPGGNVYLDGKVVGSVISDQQGRSYRQLQRSGWQA